MGKYRRSFLNRIQKLKLNQTM